MPIQGKADKVGGVATTVSEDGIWQVVTYHNTPVVKFSEKTILLNTGGYKSQTTKRRMNQAANQFELGFEVVQRKGDWFVVRGEEEIPFVEDTLRLKRN
jgi:hypothetical protein